MELEKLTLSEVIELKGNEHYFTIANHLKPKNLTESKPLDEQPFGLVKELQGLIHSSEFHNLVVLYIRWCSGIDETEITDKMQIEVLELDFFEFYYQWRYIIEEVKKSLTREDKILKYIPTGKEEEAGISELYQFGVFSTIDTLAGGDVLKYKEIENQPYGLIFTKLYLEKTKAEFNSNYTKISNRR